MRLHGQNHVVLHTERSRIVVTEHEQVQPPAQAPQQHERDRLERRGADQRRAGFVLEAAGEPEQHLAELIRSHQRLDEQHRRQRERVEDDSGEQGRVRAAP